jgi:hypothetical protein
MRLFFGFRSYKVDAARVLVPFAFFFQFSSMRLFFFLFWLELGAFSGLNSVL